MTRATAKTAWVLIYVLAFARIAVAHEGPHKVMGTVSAVHEHQLDVKATDGKSVSILVDEKTKVVHGKMAMKVTHIKPGDRVVVTALEKKGSDGKATLTASEIRLGDPVAKRPAAPPE